MATKEKENLDLNAPVTITAADLLALFAKIQQDSAKAQVDVGQQNAQVLATALEKLSPHYKDPAQLENIRQTKEVTKQQQLSIIRNTKRTQKNCPHEQGQTGEDRNGKSAFNMLQLPTGELIGICSYCQLCISSINPKHTHFFQKRSGQIARSGQFTEYLLNPLEAQMARLNEDEKVAVLKARKEYAERPQLQDED